MLSILKKKSGGNDKSPNDHRLLTCNYIHENIKIILKYKINIMWNNNNSK